ncbi:hypothetical protein V2W30_37600 [Streptomyces sp. Q6]|uniref:Uncharacterized protein n=1 Tax=Streptomyces citrinus TaxID=3118173 RepID=A0ACD5AN74_9ACTN
MTIRRRAAGAGVALTALACLSLLTACGQEKAGEAGPSAAPRAVAPPSPRPVDCAGVSIRPTVRPSQPAEAGDANPKYEENHAFQSTADLSGQAVCDAAEAKERVEKALAPYARRRDVTDRQVTAALADAGYEKVTVRGTRGFVSFVVDRSPAFCLDGSLGGMLRLETHGAYLEGTGCEKPQGGH